MICDDMDLEDARKAVLGLEPSKPIGDLLDAQAFEVSPGRYIYFADDPLTGPFACRVDDEYLSFIRGEESNPVALDEGPPCLPDDRAYSVGLVKGDAAAIRATIEGCCSAIAAGEKRLKIEPPFLLIHRFIDSEWASLIGYPVQEDWFRRWLVDSKLKTVALLDRNDEGEFGLCIRQDSRVECWKSAAQIEEAYAGAPQSVIEDLESLENRLYSRGLGAIEVESWRFFPGLNQLPPPGSICAPTFDSEKESVDWAVGLRPRV